MHLCENDGDDFRGSSNESHSMPVWRRSGLLSVRLHSVDGPGCRWPSPCSRQAHGRRPVHGLRSSRQAMAKTAKCPKAPRVGTTAVFSFQYLGTLKFTGGFVLKG